MPSHACLHACLLQVKNNYIESYGPALQLGSNVFAPTPFNYPDMNSISFTGNSIVNSQFGTVIIESAGSVTLSNTKFKNVMCRRAAPLPPSQSTPAIRVASFMLVSDLYTPVHCNHACMRVRQARGSDMHPSEAESLAVLQQPDDQHARVLLADPLHAYSDERRDRPHAQR